MSSLVYLQNVGQFFSLAGYFAHKKTLNNQFDVSVIVFCNWPISSDERELLSSICKRLYQNVDVREISRKQKKIISSPFRSLGSKRAAWAKLSPDKVQEIVFGHQLNSSRDAYSFIRTFPAATVASFGDNGTFYDWGYFQEKTNKKKITPKELLSRLLRKSLSAFFETETLSYTGYSPAPKFFGSFAPELVKITQDSIIDFFAEPFWQDDAIPKLEIAPDAIIVLLPTFANSGLMTRNDEIELVRASIESVSIDGQEIWFAQHPNSKQPWLPSEIRKMGIIDPEKRNLRSALQLETIPIEFILSLLSTKPRFLSFSAASINLTALGMQVDHAISQQRLSLIRGHRQVPDWIIEQNIHYLEVMSEMKRSH